MVSRGHVRGTQYQYIKLDKLEANTTANVYAIVKYVKPILPTRVSDYFKTIHIHDEYLERRGNRLTVTIFAHRKDQLPDCNVGDIIRLHRMQVDGYNGAQLAKLNLNVGGSWVLFDSDSESYKPKSASNAEPSWHNSEELLITQLRHWVRDGQHSSTLPHSAIDLTQSSNVPSTSYAHPKFMSIADTGYSTLADIKLDGYSCLRCQLLARSLLTNNENKVATLSVWDGTKCRLNLNPPDLDEFTTETYGAVVDVLSGLIVNLVLYGDHVKRAKQLKMGGLYRFSGVHCKLYASVGMPELYIHDRYKILATPLPPSDQPALLSQLKSALHSNPHLSVETVTDTRTNHELDVEMSSQQFAPEFTASSQCDSINTSTTTAVTSNDATSVVAQSCISATITTTQVTGVNSTTAQGTAPNARTANGGIQPKTRELNSNSTVDVCLRDGVILQPTADICRNDGVMLQPTAQVCRNDGVVVQPTAQVCRNDEVILQPITSVQDQTHLKSVEDVHYLDSALLYSATKTKTTSNYQSPNMAASRTYRGSNVQTGNNGDRYSGGGRGTKRPSDILAQCAYDNQLLKEYVIEQQEAALTSGGSEHFELFM